MPRVAIVPVDPVHGEVRSVQVHQPILDGDFGQSEVMRHDFARTVPPDDAHTHVIQERMFGIPIFGVRNIHYGTFARIRMRGGHDIPVTQNGPFDAGLPFGPSLHGDLCERIIHTMGTNHEVLEMRLRPSDHIHVTEDAGRPPHILILKIGTIRILQHRDHEQVQPRMHRIGHVEFRRQARALRHADVCAIDMNLSITVHTIETQNNALTICSRLHIHHPLIHARRRGGRHQRRVDGERERLVGIVQTPIPVKLPHMRHLHLIPIIGD